jgi:hypothetical protein
VPRSRPAPDLEPAPVDGVGSQGRPVQAGSGTRSDRGCAHHWLIESPNGSTSSGICRKCGCRRDFSNTMDGPDYLLPNGSDWSSMRGRRD